MHKGDLYRRAVSVRLSVRLVVRHVRVFCRNEERLPLTRWWRKSSNMTVGQSSLISLAHHCHCGWTCNHAVNIKSWRRRNWKSAQVVNAHLVCDPTIRQPGLTSFGNSGLCWTVFARNRDTAVPAEGNDDLQTLICVLVARLRRCPTLSNPVPWQNWMANYIGYTLRMKMLFRGWPIMVHDTHTRKRRRSRWVNTSWNFFTTW